MLVMTITFYYKHNLHENLSSIVKWGNESPISAKEEAGHVSSNFKEL